MADYTQFSLTIYACPEDRQAEALKVIHEEGLSLEWAGPADRLAVLQVGSAYTEFEYRCGDSGNLAGKLAELGATFECWEEPKYEWLGEYFAHVPGLGLFSSECDANGTPVISAHGLRELVDRAATEAGLPDVLRIMVDAEGKILNARRNVEIAAEDLQDLIAAGRALERLQETVAKETGSVWAAALKPLRDARDAEVQARNQAERDARDAEDDETDASEAHGVSTQVQAGEGEGGVRQVLREPPADA